LNKSIYNSSIDKNSLEHLVKLIKESNNTVIFTGAGMSTECGIPDFRSKEGWWKKINPMSVATREALHNNYELFHEFYSVRIRDLEICKPHEGHYILAKWEREGIIHSIATQNVDGFHRAAGSKRVYELHGSIKDIVCDSCQNPETLENFLNRNRCKCGGKLRPKVVLFGEGLPMDAWSNALRDIEECDLLIVIGTSLQVYPVNQLPNMTKGKLVLINNELVEGNYEFDVIIKGKAKGVLQEISLFI